MLLQIRLLQEADIDTGYMYYLMLGLKFILLFQPRGIAQLNINQIILKNTTLLLPPLTEQKRIFQKLEELLPLCDKLIYR